MIDLKTGKPLPDRQVIAGIDLDDEFMPTSRFFPSRYYIPDPDGPFGKARLADQPAIVRLRRNTKENHEFAKGSSPTRFHRTGIDPDPDRLHTIAYTDGNLSQMHGEGCAILSILGDGRMRLNCKMSNTAAGAPLLSPSGIVGIYLSEGMGYYFGASEIADLERIATKYKPKHFIEVSNENEPSFISMVLTTNCRTGVKFYLRYVALNDSSRKFRQTTGRVGKGEQRIVQMRSDNSIFYLAGKSGKKVWGRDRKFSGRMFSQIDVKRAGDYFWKFNCN
ncbi:hypothetical protein [Sulfitobacter undariae]|uniref:hypothetical protein n=1 Tax=Sulfitobacter undariae TaxID=1563671 RepID=UPI001622B42B|nr:hypothetical protein [Sulfitobacter undariae]